MQLVEAPGRWGDDVGVRAARAQRVLRRRKMARLISNFGQGLREATAAAATDAAAAPPALRQVEVTFEDEVRNRGHTGAISVG